MAAHVDSPHCPRQQRDYFLEKKSSDSYVDTLKSSDFYMRKEKLRLISGHFEKFGLISDQKKSSDSYLVHLIKFRLFYDINPKIYH